MPSSNRKRPESAPSPKRLSVLMPSDVSARVGFFDRFAGWAATFASRAPFFAFCFALVVMWIIQGIVTLAVTGDVSRLVDDKYQLEINTTTTIITFLLVALLQNTQTREDQATQHKLNAIADAMADMMARMAEHYGDPTLNDDIRELRLAVGLEERESTDQGGDDLGASEDPQEGNGDAPKGHAG